ncbi:MAG: hypothetical protein WCV81_03350 [Microgenomates group bacterium]|jgi:hypothetical protein
MLDNEPEEYEFRHKQRIYLDGYQGVAKGLMQLNDPVADGFMRVADMRGNIQIIQKPQDRVRDYEDVGFVRIGKFLKMPRLDFWHGDGLVETKKEEGNWFIAINDEDLADKVARTNDGTQKFDDLYLEAFNKEVKRGLTTCLKREKLLNSGNYNLGLVIGYNAFIDIAVLLPGVAVAQITTGENPLYTALILSGLYTFWTGAHNAINLFGAGLHIAEDKIFAPHQPKGFPKYKSLLPNFQDPFTKHSILDMVLGPNVPVDRLFRGLRYLDKHGNQLIEARS